MLKKTSLSVFSLAMLITVSIDSVRNLPATALFGSSLVFFFVFAALVFLIPAALISAELSTIWTEEGGIYHWVRQAFGDRLAFLAIWFQWINTMVWYPSILLFIAGTITYVVDKTLLDNRTYLVTLILTVFWFLTWMNTRGLQTSARFASWCAVIGMIVPMAMIIGLGAYWFVGGHPLSIHLSWHDMLPTLGHSQSWISLTAIMAAFLGMELATVHIRTIKDAQTKFPKALFWSVLIITITMVFGSLSIAFVIPPSHIHLIDGVMQTFHVFLGHYHMAWLAIVVAAMLLMGSLGGMVNWMISPANGLLQAAEGGYLPAFFQQLNDHQVPARILYLQAVIVSIICLMLFKLMPSINGFYWLLTDLSTQLYMLMYVMMFLAALVIKRKFCHVNRTFCVPGGRQGFNTTAILGLLGCVITLVVGFFPPSQINVGSVTHYEITFGVGMLSMVAPVWLFYRHKRRHDIRSKQITK